MGPIITPLKTLRIIILFFALLIGVSWISLSLGPTRVGAFDVFHALLGLSPKEGPERVIVLFLRLPRVLLAAMVGAGLAVAGAAFQALTRNPLADPFILGVSSGAAFGVVIANMLGLGWTFTGYIGFSLFAFLGAILAATVVYAVASVNGRLPIQSILLAGVIVSLFFSASITLFISLIEPSDLGRALHWMMGSLGPIDYGLLLLLFGFLLLGIGTIYLQAKGLNLLALGEEAALQLGVEGERVKRVVFVMASLLTGAVVAFSGSIGFVGLIVPHTIRMTLGSDNRVLIPAAALAGASLLVAADSVARTIVGPTEVPVGVITSFCGAPFFVYLLRKRYRSAL